MPRRSTRKRGPGRPPGAPGTVRDVPLNIRTTTAERAAIESAAASADPPVPASSWVRDRALEALPRDDD